MRWSVRSTPPSSTSEEEPNLLPGVTLSRAREGGYRRRRLLAGLQAARSLRSQGFDGRLVVIGDERHRPCDRPPLSKEFLAGRIGPESLLLEDTDDDLDAEWVLGTPAAALDTVGREVVLADGRRIVSDGVVFATGARARVLPKTGALAGVHVLRTLDDALAPARRPDVRVVAWW